MIQYGPNAYCWLFGPGVCRLWYPADYSYIARPHGDPYAFDVVKDFGKLDEWLTAD